MAGSAGRDEGSGARRGRRGRLWRFTVAIRRLGATATSGRWEAARFVRRRRERHRDGRESCGTPRLLMRRHIRPIGQRFAVERNLLYTKEKLHSRGRTTRGVRETRGKSP